ncbi:hypothetical protein [Halapricum hydrolyticum]|uniref:Uncharacterized protein n=1 Tax=Halapricum hydrolyticum TaxID=2979991 RepID=A0AAE3LJB7_9EURY|nr:hypothetical protein [Halapricum hydrolyticum]MCU4717978.1 hypothetical protein [Halapricum hydrolyticum]MCU4727143.1 hypothetical protein [Halapricum hydrolyticum]
MDSDRLSHVEEYKGRTNQRSWKRKISGMGRRGFIKALAGFGASSTALSHVSQRAFAENIDDPRREVLRTESLIHKDQEAVEEGKFPERQAEFDSIPRNDWIRIEAPHRRAKRLQQELPGDFDVAVGHDNGFDPKITIHCEEEDKERIMAESPGRVDANIKSKLGKHSISNIPVEVETKEVEEHDEAPDDYFDAKYRPIPGGCMGGGASTATPAAVKATTGDNWYKGLLLSGHQVNYNSGTTVNQHGDKIGEVKRATANEGLKDAAAVVLMGPDYRFQLAKDGCACYSKYDITGILTDEKLRDKVAYGYSISAQLHETGRHRTKELYEFIHDDHGGRSIAFKNDFSISGDSGGLYWFEKFDPSLHETALVAGINFGDWSAGNGWHTTGNTAEFVEDALDVKI